MLQGVDLALTITTPRKHTRLVSRNIIDSLKTQMKNWRQQFELYHHEGSLEKLPLVIRNLFSANIYLYKYNIRISLPSIHIAEYSRKGV